MSLLNRPIPLWSLLPTALLATVLGFAIDRFVTPTEQESHVRKSGELRMGAGLLTNPLLECEVFEEQGLQVLKPFRFKVEALLEEKLAAGVITEGSVYFRDMNNGIWFGINEQFKYHPASLLKVPLMIACFKKAETDPQFLARKILYQGDLDFVRYQSIKPSGQLEPGHAYTVEDLINFMIIFSDNNAARLLAANLGKASMNWVMQDIDVNMDPGKVDYSMTLHGYAGVFRVLFNASYLNREFSERALHILTRSEFSGGVRGGLPPGQLAATKFGEAGDTLDPQIVQLHEVGIVYYPGRPYLLGVMTRGRRGNDLSGVMREISRLVYDSVSAQEVPSGKPSSKVFQ